MRASEIVGRVALCGVICALVAALGAGAAPRGAPRSLEAGVASRTITPPLKPDKFIAGYSGNRVAEKVHDALYARTLALRAGDTTVALCTVDLVGLLRPDIQLIREHVNGLPPEHIIISSTHTHSGPDTIGLWGATHFETGVNAEYMSFLREQIALCITEAIRALEPAEIRFATAKQPPKTAKNSRAADEIDTDIEIVQVRKPGGEIMATLVNWGCHPEVLNEHTITSDVAGYLRRQVEEDGGGRALYFQAIVGGMVTADCDGSTFAEAERIGRAAGSAAMEAVNEAQWVDKLRIEVRRAEVRLPVDNLRFKLAAAAGVIPGFKPANSTTAEITFIDMGRAQLITMPGEVLPALGLRMKGLLNARHKLFLGLAGDELGYILPEEYCTQELYDYEVSMSLGPKTGPLLYEALEELVRAEQ